MIVGTVPKKTNNANEPMLYMDEVINNIEDKETKTPKHYETNSIDVIDFCKLYDLNFNLGNIVKYACRVGKKENDIEDLKKVIDYAQREIKYLKTLKNN